MSRKVFTAGEVLAAADVNSFLMDQTVMSFAGTAARGSAIPSPVEGMYTHLEDLDRLDFWNGSAWTPASGMSLVSNLSFTGSGAVAVDNVFTSTYRNYFAIVNVLGSAGANHILNLRAGGATNSTSNYTYGGQTVVYGSNAVNGAQAVNGTGWPEGSRATAGDRGSTQLMFYSPQLAEKTFYQASTTDAQITRQVGGVFNATTQFDGFIFTAQSGTLSGNICVYGVRN